MAGPSCKNLDSISQALSGKVQVRWTWLWPVHPRPVIPASTRHSATTRRRGEPALVETGAGIHNNRGFPGCPLETAGMTIGGPMLCTQPQIHLTMSVT